MQNCARFFGSLDRDNILYRLACRHQGAAQRDREFYKRYDSYKSDFVGLTWIVKAENTLRLYTALRKRGGFGVSRPCWINLLDSSCAI